jgi:hypothetical protein
MAFEQDQDQGIGANQTGPGTAPSAADIGASISDSAGAEKPKRKYVRSGKFSKQNQSTPETPGTENVSVDISDADKALYQDCFGQSVEEGIKAISNVLSQNAYQRLKKIECEEKDCVEISNAMEIRPATAKALNKQAVILARKYDLLSKFGVEAVVLIELGTWGAQLATAFKRIGELERKVLESKKIQSSTPA